MHKGGGLRRYCGANLCPFLNPQLERTAAATLAARRGWPVSQIPLA